MISNNNDNMFFIEKSLDQFTDDLRNSNSIELGGFNNKRKICLILKEKLNEKLKSLKELDCFKVNNELPEGYNVLAKKVIKKVIKNLKKSFEIDGSDETKIIDLFVENSIRIYKNFYIARKVTEKYGDLAPDLQLFMLHYESISYKAKNFPMFSKKLSNQNKCKVKKSLKRLSGDIMKFENTWKQLDRGQKNMLEKECGITKKNIEDVLKPVLVDKSKKLEKSYLVIRQLMDELNKCGSESPEGLKIIKDITPRLQNFAVFVQADEAKKFREDFRDQIKDLIDEGEQHGIELVLL